jgi:Ca2+-binding EF-hand superfamily protein
MPDVEMIPPGHISIKAFPKQMRDRMEEFDQDGNGYISVEELQLVELGLEKLDLSVSIIP